MQSKPQSHSAPTQRLCFKLPVKALFFLFLTFHALSSAATMTNTTMRMTTTATTAPMIAAGGVPPLSGTWFGGMLPVADSKQRKHTFYSWRNIYMLLKVG